MSSDRTNPRSLVGRVFSSILRILLLMIILFVVGMLTSSFSWIEIPVHIVIGWAFHAWQNFPRLFPLWTSVLIPLACLIIAGYLFHRFIHWWIHAKALNSKWKPSQSATVIGLLLLASSAAIAMSGITHQFAWLMSEPWTENRGRRAELTNAVSNTRQLMLALLEYQERQGRLPDSLLKLQTEEQLPRSLFWVKPGKNDAPEPFVLLQAGKALPSNPEEPVIISPAIGSDRKIAVGFSDCSVRSMTEPMLNRLLDGLERQTPPTAPSAHE